VAVRPKVTSYLNALADPTLAEDRRFALDFMQRVQMIRGIDEPNDPDSLDQEQQDLMGAITCANCLTPLQAVTMFCRDAPCQEEAKAIRYIRSVEADGRIEQPDVQAAVGVKLWMLTAGGYASEERKLSSKVHENVLKRDDYTCRLCGAPAVEVDHIVGGSDEPTNLRALCGPCNRREAFSRKGAVEGEEAEALQNYMLALAERVAAITPMRVCDDPSRWKQCWAGILAARRRLTR
jgi:hypothetical protein